MLDAAVRLLASDGPTAVTPARVATEAGVHRATAYRLWPDAESLLAEVMGSTELPFLRDPAVPVRAWLRRALRELADDLATSTSHAATVTLMQAARYDPAVAAQRDSLAAAMQARLDAAQDLALAAAEIVDRRDPAVLAALLIGPLLYRITFEGGTVTDSMIDEIVDRLF